MTRVTETRPAVDAPPRAMDSPGLRVDAPHALGDSSATEALTPVPFAEPEAAAPVELDFDAAAQLQHQAGQLAAHLVARQRELDHREARLHANVALWESELARQRLTLEERERAALETEQRLSERASELAARESAASKRETDARREQVEAEFFLRRQEEELELRETQVTLVEERLTNEQRLVRRTSEELAKSRERFQRLSRRLQQRLDRRRIEFEEQSRQALEALERRRAAIESAGARGDASEPAPNDEIEQLRVVLRMELLAVKRMLDEREQAAEELERRRAEFLSEQASESARVAERERELAALSTELDARRAALERSAAEVTEKHQAVLQERLAVEELWARFASRDEIDALRPKLTELEARLSESYAAERADLVARTQELEQLRRELLEEHARQARQQTALESWTAARQKEIGEKTRELTRRAHDLELRSSKLHREEVELRLARTKRAGNR